LYLPPLFVIPTTTSNPLQMIISLPVHTAVWSDRAEGEVAMLVAVQLFEPVLYLAPVLNRLELSSPPQTIISLPVQTAVCWARASGALIVLVAVQLSVLGLYLPPVLK
jgi:hypothetical protein